MQLLYLKAERTQFSFLYAPNLAGHPLINAGVNVTVNGVAPYSFWSKIKLQRQLRFNVVFFVQVFN